MLQATATMRWLLYPQSINLAKVLRSKMLRILLSFHRFHLSSLSSKEFP
jgi:hypothetical protein